MSTLVLIPARGGSKRVKDKNLRSLGSMPLINWTINTANALPFECSVIVSTDSPKIAEVAKKAGGYVPWIRPEYLSTDEATSLEVAIHALEWHEKNVKPVNTVILLQPTSPFRKVKDICKAMRILEENQLNAVVGVSKAKTHPLWAMKVVGNELKPYCEKTGLGMRSQDLPDAYEPNGSIYVIRASILKKEMTFFPSKTGMCIVDESESVDIDTIEDLQMARKLLRSSKWKL